MFAQHEDDGYKVAVQLLLDVFMDLYSRQGNGYFEPLLASAVPGGGIKVDASGSPDQARDGTGDWYERKYLKWYRSMTPANNFQGGSRRSKRGGRNTKKGDDDVVEATMAGLADGDDEALPDASEAVSGEIAELCTSEKAEEQNGCSDNEDPSVSEEDEEHKADEVEQADDPGAVMEDAFKQALGKRPHEAKPDEGDGAPVHKKLRPPKLVDHADMLRLLQP